MTRGHAVNLAGLRGQQMRDAYDQVRQAIIGGSLAPGARLVETDLAHNLGISRSSVRTILHRLQQEGFVDASATSARSRLTVNPLTRQDFWELSEIVGELEGLAAQRAAGLPAPERRRLVAELRRINQRLAELLREEPRNRFLIFQVDDELHNALVAGAGSQRLRTLHHAVKPQMQRYEGVYFTMADRIKDSIREHAAGIDAIAQGKAMRAHEAIRKNLLNAAHFLAARMEERGEVGSFARRQSAALPTRDGKPGSTRRKHH
jgi:DNA-binding GntR family transcriptional regulator